LYLAAWFQTVRGKPADALKLNESAPVPKPAQGEVLVRGMPYASEKIGLDDIADLPPIF
jgi:hypothetical protein